MKAIDAKNVLKYPWLYDSCECGGLKCTVSPSCSKCWSRKILEERGDASERHRARQRKYMAGKGKAHRRRWLRSVAGKLSNKKYNDARVREVTDRYVKDQLTGKTGGYSGILFPEALIELKRQVILARRALNAEKRRNETTQYPISSG